jgi:2-desacetyl-2-hydroxyethyl bacteriochlorophyllide A dehydrogenase
MEVMYTSIGHSQTHNMKTLICTEPGSFRYTDTEMPQRKKGQSLLKVKQVGVCGTDLHAFEGTQPYFSYPRILGHEIAADIVETDAPGFSKDDKVTLLPYFNCGTCIACRQGLSNCCASLEVFGVHIDGAMREYISVPSEKLVKSEGLGYDELALAEPLSIGAHGIRRAQIRSGEHVLIIGAGPIGLGAVLFAKRAGATVIALDLVPSRLQFCKDILGADHTINAAEVDAVAAVREITKGDMAPVVIDATGSRRAIESMIGYLAHGGRMILIGLQKEAFAFSHPEFHKREATLMSSRNATMEDMNHVLSAFSEGLIPTESLITHRCDFADLAAKFPGWLSPQAGVIKAMIQL